MGEKVGRESGVIEARERSEMGEKELNKWGERVVGYLQDWCKRVE